MPVHSMFAEMKAYAMADLKLKLALAPLMVIPKNVIEVEEGTPIRVKLIYRI